MPNLKPIITLPETTVITEFNLVNRKATSYQTETQLENAFIKLLTEQGYEYLNIHSESDLISNLRKQIEKLNSYTFTDNEWQLFFNNELAHEKDGTKEKTEKIQITDGLLLLKKE
jgi:type I restriction enzyme R subunit